MRSIKCSAMGCIKPAKSSGLCGMHYYRWQQHKQLEPVNTKGHGSRKVHSLYRNWNYLRKARRIRECCQEWLDDFWLFAAAIGEKPTGKRYIVLSQIDGSKPLGPDNWYWREPADPIKAKSRREYMRLFNARQRVADPWFWKNAYLKKRYGVTLDWYEAKLKEQKGLCAICGKPETKSTKGKVYRLAVDHCHDSGKVRGLLCMNCNYGIGHMKHDPKILKAAIAYLGEE